MSQEQVVHETFEGHPYTHLYTAPGAAGAVVFRTDLMQQVVCSPRAGELVRAVLSGEASAEALPPAVRGLLVDTPPGLPESARATVRTGVAEIQTLYVVPTFECQLGCGYCRITREQGRQEGRRLSPEAAREAIDRVLGAAPSGARRTLVFFGGEPLLVPETVFSAISHLRKRPEGDNTDIMLQTNGIAIDTCTAEFLAAHDVFVYLSLDGMADVHDRNRRLLAGGGSFEASVAGYCNAKQQGCRLGISATATKGTADRFAASFEEMISKLLPDKCGAVTHLHPMTGARSPQQCSPADSARIQIETFLAARRLGIYHQQMCERIAPFVSGSWRRYACAGCGGKVVVAPDGTAGICEYNAGAGRSFVPLEEFSEEAVSDFMGWAARSPLDARECVQCPALPTCGGGCAYDSQILMGDALTFDPWLCETNVLIIHWLMRDLLSQLQDKLGGDGFHIVTEPERALVLGNIRLEDAQFPIARVAGFGGVPETGECLVE